MEDGEGRTRLHENGRGQWENIPGGSCSRARARLSSHVLLQRGWAGASLGIINCGLISVGVNVMIMWRGEAFGADFFWSFP